MANEIIRKSTAHPAELAEFKTECEICGHTGIFEDFLWCDACDVIHCTHYSSCINAHISCNQEGMLDITWLLKTFNKVNSDCIRDGKDSVPFTDIDYYAEQIEDIYGVSEIRAYELATQLLEESKMETEFTITGFHHVTAAGMLEFWQLLEEKGTVDLLWDMKPATKTNALMQSENFDMDAHIKTNYVGQDYDEIMTELHDEMVDAITALEFCFVTNQTAIHFNGRSIENLDCIPPAKEWNPNVYYPLTAGHTFKTFDDFEAYCMDTLCEPHDPGFVAVTITTHKPNEDECGEDLFEQVFDYTVTGAADSNCLRSVIESFEGWGYTNFSFTLK